jgi:hypothetical protein
MTGSCGDRTAPVSGCIRGTPAHTDASHDQRRDETIVENVGTQLRSRERVSSDHSRVIRRNIVVTYGSSIGQSGRASIGRQSCPRSRVTASRVNG